MTITPDRLRLLREEAGLSRDALAATVGVTSRMVAYWETGRSTPEAANTGRLAQALDCSTSDLTGVEPGTETLAELRYTAGLSSEQAVAVLRAVPALQNLHLTATKVRDLERGRRVQGWAWRDPAALGRLVNELASAYQAEIPTVVDAWMRSRPHDPAPDLPLPRSRPPSERTLHAWGSLNEQQCACLEQVYWEDRMTEVEVWLRRRHQMLLPPADQWRRLPLQVKAPPDLVGTPRLQQRMRDLGLDPTKAQSLLRQLTGLVEVIHDSIEIGGNGPYRRVCVVLTRQGRAAVRAGLGEPHEKAPPAHLLSRWHWGKLLRVADAGLEGIPDSRMTTKARFFLGVGYRPGGKRPGRGFINTRPLRDTSGAVVDYMWTLTDLGKRHILAYAHLYQELYPDVEVPTIPEDHATRTNAPKYPQASR
ncbi:helix-turn-helix domain-containing protein [Nocardiopsis dassonvillei]|uniref:helix-turn-helix domain-containing protein n=1 Tax=Nocardiopsis dassonvillei TaxID=2014 RepID=UPI0012FDE730|nr:helix-turn-helix transcriptional regulator [Nocardiopsis dassonvillei]